MFVSKIFRRRNSRVVPVVSGDVDGDGRPAEGSSLPVPPVLPEAGPEKARRVRRCCRLFRRNPPKVSSPPSLRTDQPTPVVPVEEEQLSPSPILRFSVKAIPATTDLRSLLEKRLPSDCDPDLPPAAAAVDASEATDADGTDPGPSVTESVEVTTVKQEVAEAESSVLKEETIDDVLAEMMQAIDEGLRQDRDTARLKRSTAVRDLLSTDEDSLDDDKARPFNYDPDSGVVLHWKLDVL